MRGFVPTLARFELHQKVTSPFENTEDFRASEAKVDGLRLGPRFAVHFLADLVGCEVIDRPTLRFEESWGS